MTNQNINNNSVHQQTNITNVENLHIGPKTRWQKRFEELMMKDMLLLLMILKNIILLKMALV